MTVQTPDPVDIDFREFLKRSTEIIEEWADRLRSPADIGTGRWHPTGFMVFNLCDVEGFGLLRLHVWPSGRRQRRPNHPDIHSHCFHLNSAIVKGTYRESLYTVTSATEPERADLRHGFLVEPATGDGLDRLELDPARYSVAIASANATYGPGERHAMLAGEYHATDIPADTFTATLALLSRPIPDQRDHLVGTEQPELIAKRGVVTPYEQRTVCSYLW